MLLLKTRNSNKQKLFERGLFLMLGKILFNMKFENYANVSFYVRNFQIIN